MERFRFRAARLRVVRYVLCAAMLAAWPADAADPQVDSLEALRRASTVPVEIGFAQSALRSVSCQVPVSGRGAVEQARSFVTEYGDLLLRAAAPVESSSDENPDVDLEVRGVYREPGQDMVVFRQLLGGLPVFGGSVSVAVRAGRMGRADVVFANGSLLPAVQRGLDLDPEIDEQEAVMAAASHLHRTVPPLLGDPELVIWSDAIAGGAGRPKLVWSVGVGGGDPWRVLVDANDRAGVVVFSYPLTETGAGTDDWDLDLEDANGDNITNTQCFDPTTIDDEIADEDGLSGDYVGLAWAQKRWDMCKTTYLYYHDHLKRHSWDDDDAEMLIYMNSNFQMNNAQYYHGCGIEFAPAMFELDVLTHEFTHGVIRFSSNLVYANQPGALNESFADLFGEMSDPDAEWMMGEDLVGLGALRSLKDPLNDLCGPNLNKSLCGDPDRMVVYNPTASDNGGVHSNSGIPNKAGFLMTDGGSFNGVDVGTGMGRWKFERLAYQVMRYLGSMAQFQNARDSYVTAAQSWAAVGKYGFTAADVCTVRNAWAAVEVGFADLDCNGSDDSVDDDGDGIPTFADNCDAASNPSQDDWDNDGQGDACDSDDDADGCIDALDKCAHFANGPCYGFVQTDYDSDGLGEACDPDDDGDGVLDAADNCRLDANPDQLDGNADGFGDACDPDEDGDGKFGTDDNCTFDANANQADADGDGLGDACDLCPNVADNSGIWTKGFPGVPPKPYQPDSDGDGTPDACDSRPFGTLGVQVNGRSPNPADPLRADGTRHTMTISGEGSFRVPLPVCTGADADVLAANEMVEIAVDGLLQTGDAVSFWIADELDQRITKLGANAKGTLRGMRFRPDCAHRYFLHGATSGALANDVSLQVRERVTRRGRGNPWSLPKLEPTTRPDRAPEDDADGDGRADADDNCPSQYNPDQADSDNDGVGDQCSDCGRTGCLAEVTMDVVPGKLPNVLRANSRGYVKIAVLSEPGFDATGLVSSSIVIGGTGIADPARQVMSADVDRDGDLDLVVRVPAVELSLTEATTRVHLVARTTGGVRVHAVDTVTVEL